MSQINESPMAPGTPDAAAGSLPTFLKMMSTRRCPSLFGIVRSQAASPAMPTNKMLVNGSSEPRFLSSGITALGCGFHSGLNCSVSAPPGPYCTAQVRALSPTTIDSEPPDGTTPDGV